MDRFAIWQTKVPPKAALTGACTDSLPRTALRKLAMCARVATSEAFAIRRCQDGTMRPAFPLVDIFVDIFQSVYSLGVISARPASQSMDVSSQRSSL